VKLFIDGELLLLMFGKDIVVRDGGLLLFVVSLDFFRKRN
jgi:hypothetical protein